MTEYSRGDQRETRFSRMEWDDPCFQKREWPKGPWLNEPDKVQFMKLGFPCLILRSEHGGLCGYVGVRSKHPAYGLSYEGYSQLIADIIHVQAQENLTKWAKRGYPKNKLGLPDMEYDWIEPPKLTPVGQAVYNIKVHGGLTYSGTPTSSGPANWQKMRNNFPKAREVAKQYPIGDAARWLYRWGPAETDYEEFKRICCCTCICFEPPDEEIWLFGFDCAHGGDRMPAIEGFMESLDKKLQAEHPGIRRVEDEYRTIEYVEKECEKLAFQLEGIGEMKEPSVHQ